MEQSGRQRGGVDRANEISASTIVTPEDVGHCPTWNVTALAQE